MSNDTVGMALKYLIISLAADLKMAELCYHCCDGDEVTDHVGRF